MMLEMEISEDGQMANGTRDYGETSIHPSPHPSHLRWNAEINVLYEVIEFAVHAGSISSNPLSMYNAFPYTPTSKCLNDHVEICVLLLWLFKQ